MGGIGGLSQINTCRQKPLLVNLKEKLTFRVWCLYRYLVHIAEYYKLTCRAGGPGPRYTRSVQPSNTTTSLQEQETGLKLAEGLMNYSYNGSTPFCCAKVRRNISQKNRLSNAAFRIITVLNDKAQLI